MRSIWRIQRSEGTLALLVSRGVDINARNSQEQGLTALHAAALAGEANGVRLLLAHGARADLQDDKGRTALELARTAAGKHPDDAGLAEVVQLLRDVQSAINR